MAAANAQGPALMFGLGGSALSQAAQWLFLTSLFAAALAFHNAVWRYAFALGREGVLPGALGRTGSNNIPKAASLAQSVTGLAVIGAFALAGWPPMTGLFFGGGTTGGFGILILLAVTSVAVIAFFARNPRGETAWSRLIAPALAAILLTGLAVLAVMHYGTLLGVPPGAAAAWALPASYAVARRRRAGVGRWSSRSAAPACTRPSASARTPPASRPPRRAPGHADDRAATSQQTAAQTAAIVRADDADIEVLSQVIADAFFPLAPCRWLIPDGPPAARSSPASSGCMSSTRWPTGSSTPPPAVPPRPCGSLPGRGGRRQPGGVRRTASRGHRSVGRAVRGL